MKNSIKILIAVLIAVFAVACCPNTQAQEFYGKVGPSLTILKTDCGNYPSVTFGGFKVEAGFKEYFLEHGAFAGAYLNHNVGDSELSNQTVFDLGYMVNFYPNFSGKRIGYFGTGIMFRTTEHNMWNQKEDCSYEGNDFNSWNIPLRAGVTLLPYGPVRIYLEGEHTLQIAGDKFHGFNLTVGAKF